MNEEEISEPVARERRKENGGWPLRAGFREAALNVQISHPPL